MTVGANPQAAAPITEKMLCSQGRRHPGEGVVNELARNDLTDYAAIKHDGEAGTMIAWRHR